MLCRKAWADFAAPRPQITVHMGIIKSRGVHERIFGSQAEPGQAVIDDGLNRPVHALLERVICKRDRAVGEAEVALLRSH